jgi:GH25 family lysozyme M1 (1,4-beta-N-acetylmuramidase)
MRLNGNPNRQYFADISDDQRDFNAHQYASAGHLAVAIKRTEGADLRQVHDIDRVYAAHDAGLRVLHYHFADLEGGATWEDEARNFWLWTRPTFMPGDRLVVDVEITGRIGGPAVAGWIKRFAGAIVGHAAIDVMVYCPLSMLLYTTPALDVPGHLFWVAAWGGYVPPLGGDRRRFAHQYSNGQVGPEPREFAGVSRCDGSILTRYGLKALTERS